MVRFIACKVVGEGESEAAERLTQTTVAFIEQRLGPGYGWPGNFRELEQCVRNILIRKSYRPAGRAPAPSDAEKFTAAFETGSLTADELLNLYAKQVYRQTGSYVATARRLKLDRRTIKARVDAPSKTPGTPA
jgi:DNA-binding NtrC family response regulator